MADGDRYRMTVRLSREELERLRALSRNLGIGNLSDVVRHALTELARGRGILPPAETGAS